MDAGAKCGVMIMHYVFRYSRLWRICLRLNIGTATYSDASCNSAHVQCLDRTAILALALDTPSNARVDFRGWPSNFSRIFTVPSPLATNKASSSSYSTNVSDNSAE